MLIPNAHDHWTIDGDIAFGMTPGGSTPITARDAPICLHRGDKEWGETHINARHGHWLARLGMSAPALVWQKCQQSGTIYGAETPSKLTISMQIAPSALMVLRFVRQKGFFTVVTLYNRNRAVDGARLGCYVGVKAANANPVFALGTKGTPSIVVKRSKRSLLMT